jgi:hypothetical protein
MGGIAKWTMEEVAGEGGREWGVENFSNECIDEVVYIEWWLGKTTSCDDRKVRRR